LKIGSKIAADVRTLIPVQFQPFEALVDGARSFLGVTRAVGVFDPQYELAFVVAGK
jgi:hypothetical protein